MDGNTVVRGGLTGAVVGATLTGLSALMRQKDADARDLGTAVMHLRADPLLMEVLARYKPLREHSPAMRTKFNNMVQHAEEMMRLCEIGGAGAHQIKANRAMSSVISTAKDMCRDALNVHRDDAAGELMRDTETLESLCQNHLHNMLLSG